MCYFFMQLQLAFNLDLKIKKGHKCTKSSVSLKVNVQKLSLGK